MKILILTATLLAITSVTHAQSRRDADCEEMGRWATRHLGSRALMNPGLIAKITRFAMSAQEAEFTEADLIFSISKRDAHAVVDVIFDLRDRAVRRYGKQAVIECMGAN